MKIGSPERCGKSVPPEPEERVPHKRNWAALPTEGEPVPEVEVFLWVGRRGILAAALSYGKNENTARTGGKNTDKTGNNAWNMGDVESFSGGYESTKWDLHQNFRLKRPKFWRISGRKSYRFDGKKLVIFRGVVYNVNDYVWVFRCKSKVHKKGWKGLCKLWTLPNGRFGVSIGYFLRPF